MTAHPKAASGSPGKHPYRPVITPPPLEQAVERVKAAIRDDVALLVLASGTTLTQFQQQHPGIVDALARRAVGAAFVFEPDNHHNAALCPYCTPATNVAASGATSNETGPSLVGRGHCCFTGCRLVRCNFCREMRCTYDFHLCEPDHPPIGRDLPDSAQERVSS